MARITIQDCLEHVPNRFALVLMSAERTKQLMRGSPALIQDHRDNKEIVTSLREIAAQRVQYQESTVNEYDPASEAEIRRAAQMRKSDGKTPQPETQIATAEGDFEAELADADLDDEFAEETDLDSLFSKLDSNRPTDSDAPAADETDGEGDLSSDGDEDVI